MLPTIADWCKRKGINIVATGDWTHPEWFAHLKESFVEERQGVYRLKGVKGDGQGARRTEFMLVQEVSQIYKKNEKARRIHNLLFSPSLETCEKVITMMQAQGFNLKSDGRPILGIDSEELYKRLKDIDHKIILVPAHAWTPWYAIFGSKSGFDSIEECFGSMTPYIYAIETGLSSNPKMNWQLSSLDSVVCLSNSDAHSPRNLGREANVFEFEKPPTYDDFVKVLKEKDSSHFKYTIEFYPEEGKYYFDGCANCRFSCEPARSQKLGGRCPICKRVLTLGVHHRVEELSDREADSVADKKIPFKSLVPLAELLAEVFGVRSTQSKKVDAEYVRLTNEFTNEFSLLLDVPIQEIRQKNSDANIALAIERLRAGEVKATPGYDGIYGTISVFGKQGPSRPTQSTLI